MKKKTFIGLIEKIRRGPVRFRSFCFSEIAVFALMLSGCATQGMKSTPFYEGKDVQYVGDAADRVNLWPVAYWRNPVGSAVENGTNIDFLFLPIKNLKRRNNS